MPGPNPTVRVGLPGSGTAAFSPEPGGCGTPKRARAGAPWDPQSEESREEQYRDWGNPSNLEEKESGKGEPCDCVDPEVGSSEKGVLKDCQDPQVGKGRCLGALAP